jgi:transposase
MEVVSPRGGGLHVPKRFVVACLSIVEQGQRHKELRQLASMSSDILALKEGLPASGCRQIAMASSGVFWKALSHLLEDSFEIVLLNAQHLKAVPGRKTDVKDAQWLADLLHHGVLKAAFIASSEQQAVRDLTGRRRRLIQGRSRLINRIQKVLEEATLKLAWLVSDVMGGTGQGLLRALLAGPQAPARLAQLARGSLIKKEEQLQAAFQGQLLPHQRGLLEELLPLTATLDRCLARFERESAERLHGLEALIARLDALTGLCGGSREVLLAELGWDMSRLPEAAHAAAWLGICPANHETGGKPLSARTPQGKRWAKTVRKPAGHAAGHSQTYVGEQSPRISARRGRKQAAMAVGHRMGVIFSQRLNSGEPYHEKGADSLLNAKKEQIQQRLVRQVERLGKTVSLQPKAVTTFA